MQETKETLPEWIEREAHAALHRFTNSAGSTVDGLRAVIAPYIEAVDAAQRRARELEDTVVTQRSRIDKLEKDNAAGEYRVDELEKDLAEQRDHSRKLETELAAMRDVERTEHDATWAAYEVEKSRVRFFDALSIDSSNHGLAVALPMAMKPLLDIVVSTNADRNRLRSENLRLARDASAAREREEASRAECAALDERKAHVATKARLDAADFNKGVCGKRFDDERAAHDTTKAELAAAQERLVHYEAELRRWIGMRDEESRRREAAEMALNAAESAAVDDNAALEAERSESEAAKARVERLEATCKMARAEAIAERERAEEYLATVNGLLRRERERTEVQS